MCEDFPCCGHEQGCCPDFDKSGKQLNMKCVCGAVLPVDNSSSICGTCLHEDPNDLHDHYRDFDDDDEYEYDEEVPFDEPVEG
jgi:hypothetical protein